MKAVRVRLRPLIPSTSGRTLMDKMLRIELFPIGGEMDLRHSVGHVAVRENRRRLAVHPTPDHAGRVRAKPGFPDAQRVLPDTHFRVSGTPGREDMAMVLPSQDQRNATRRRLAGGRMPGSPDHRGTLLQDGMQSDPGSNAHVQGADGASHGDASTQISLSEDSR